MKYLFLIMLMLGACGKREIGPKGDDGVDGSFEGKLKFVELCPELEGDYPETLIYLDGEYLVYFTEANNSWENKRLAILLEDTQYRTTDGRNVYFTISEGNILFDNGSEEFCSDYTP